jgi:hypothetical protein
VPGIAFESMPVTWHSVFDTVEGLVAVGTIMLALGTLGVAVLTRSTAKATKKLADETKNLVAATVGLAEASAQEVEISRHALQAEVKPLIVDWPTEGRAISFKGSLDEGMLVVVPVCNAGATALITGVTMHWYDHGMTEPTTYIGWPTVVAPMAGGETEARFSFDRHDAARLSAIEEQGKFWVEFAYTDASGGQPEVTRLDVHYEEESERWPVWQVSFRRAGEAEPYATARPVNR